MKSILSLTLFLAFLGAKAQNNLVVFSENGEKFFLIINGVKQNLEAETNVKVTDLIQPNYKAKIVFEDKAKGVVDQNIYFMQGGEPVKNHEFVYSVGMKKKGTYKARPVSAVAIGTQTKAESDQTVVHYTTTEPTQAHNNVISDGNASSSVHVANDGTAVNNNNSNSNVGMNISVNENNLGMNANNSVTMSGSSGASTNQNGATINMNANGMNMSVNVNENNLGMNANGNVTTSGMTSTSSQTVTKTTTKSSNGTTTIDQSTTVSGSSSGNMGNATNSSKTKTRTQTKTTDGYEVGTVVDNSKGCVAGMSTADFNNAKESIEDKSFEESKLTTAKQVVDGNCMTSAQVKELMGLFSFENSKLDIAKYAYGRTVDKNNYYQVNDAFTFESSIKELDSHIKKSTK